MLDLECVEVRKRFGAFVAVDGVSFQIPAGSFFSILGPSGCGKTTLLRMIAGFETPDSGDLLVKGKSVIATPPNKRNIKMVFQHLALFPMMNVAENIAYGLRCRGAGRDEIRRRVSDALARVGLPDSGPKQINQLSGGQKQRIAIARCMALDPDVLLLDEPLGALDLKLREQMKVELKLLQHQFNTTFVYVTHDQSEALAMSDQVAVMNDGRFEQVGPPQELYANPRTAFVAGFVGDSNRWRGRVAAIDGDSVQIETESGRALWGRAAGERADLRVGGEAFLFVRPESISIDNADAAPPNESENAANAIDGKIENLLFNGANSRALARAGGDLVAANLPQAADFANLRRDAPVRLRWPRESGKCFAD